MTRLSNPPELAHQACRRPLSAQERALATELEAIFASGVSDFGEVAAELQRRGVARPSLASQGATEPWTATALQSELHLINASLDDAYLNAPAMVVYGYGRPFMGGR